MDIGVLTPSVSRQAGGLLDSVRRLAIGLHSAGNRIVVYSLSDSDTSCDLPLWTPVPVNTFRASDPSSFCYSKQLRDALLQSKHDVLLTNGLWQYFSSLARSWSRKFRRPYIANPHGMLDPWAIRNSKWRKRIAAALYEKQHLQQASCIRALCISEVESIRAYGLNNPVCVIPNGVDLPEMAKLSPPPWKNIKLTRDRKTLLSLGRIHPKKNLASLLRAWGALKQKRFKPIHEWGLVIAGWDELGHGAELQQLVTQLGIENDVYFAGPLYGCDKDLAYRCADGFVLASLSEGLPMAVLEAWAYGLPSLLTTNCNLPEGYSAGAALPIESNPASISSALEAFMQMPDEERKKMGIHGRELVEQRFNWRLVTQRMNAVLAWVTGQGEFPTFVLIADA